MVRRINEVPLDRWNPYFRVFLSVGSFPIPRSR
jgi:hypothetical protein